MSATVGKLLALSLILVSFSGCKVEKPAELQKSKREVIIRPKHPALSREQKTELGFPEDLISKLEFSAGVKAEPFFASVPVRSENLKGEKEFEEEKLTGFSVRTKNSDELIKSYRAGLRVRGFIIFKSHIGYGSLPDIVSIVKGNNSYDILKTQRTEGRNYDIDTGAIIAWLRQQQELASFAITGAGPDWVEARFIKQPVDMPSFAEKVYAFAPDVRNFYRGTADEAAEQMKEINGFYLEWD